MAISGRGRLAAGLGAVALLAGAWALTRASAVDDGGPQLTTATTTTTLTPSEAQQVDLLPDTLTEAAAGGLRFTDVTADAGLDEPHTAEPPTDDDVTTGGVAVADYDDDGDQDVYLTRLGLPGRLLRNDGAGAFADVASAAGVEGPDEQSGYAAPVWADIEGDGDLDLLLTGAGRTANVLYVNQGDGTFRDESASRGVQDVEPLRGYLGNATYGAAFSDWDHDGDLDLMVAQWYTNALFSTPDLTRRTEETETVCDLAANIPPSAPGEAPESRTRLYENDGTGRFVDVTAGSGVDADASIAFQPVFADADGDGWEDLFLTGDVCTSKLYRNLEGRGFEDVTAASGVGTDENGMGSVVEDLDGDGDLDWFITSIALPTDGAPCPVSAPTFACSGNRLYLNDGRGRFTDATDEWGVRDGSWGWGAVAGDLDADGWRDLFVVNGYRPRLVDENVQRLDGDAPLRERFDDDRNRLWLGGDERPLRQGARPVGIDDEANGKGVVAFDADGDLDLDLLIANTEAPPVLYRNDGPDDRHQLVLRLRAPGTANPFAIGAIVRVQVGGGLPDQTHVVRAGGSFQSGDPTDVHLGLGDADAVARIEITWPGGGEPQVLTDVDADRVLIVERPAP